MTTGQQRVLPSLDTLNMSSHTEMTATSENYTKMEECVRSVGKYGLIYFTAFLSPIGHAPDYPGRGGHDLTNQPLLSLCWKPLQISAPHGPK